MPQTAQARAGPSRRQRRAGARGRARRPRRPPDDSLRERSMDGATAGRLPPPASAAAVVAVSRASESIGSGSSSTLRERLRRRRCAPPTGPRQGWFRASEWALRHGRGCRPSAAGISRSGPFASATSASISARASSSTLRTSRRAPSTRSCVSPSDRWPVSTSVTDCPCVRARGGFGRGLQRRLVHRLDGRVQLSSQHQQLAARLDHDAADVATGRGHDFQRFALGSRPHLVPQPDQLVRLG